MIAALVSVVLAYFILFDTEIMNVLMFSDVSVTTSKVDSPSSKTTSVNQTKQFANTSLSMNDMILPIQLIRQQHNQFQLTRQEEVIVQVMNKLKQANAKLESITTKGDDETIASFNTETSIILTFATVLPLSLFDDYIELMNDENEFMFNQLVFTNTNQKEFYLFNTASQQYVEVAYDNSVTYNSFAALLKNNITWSDVESVQLKNKLVYLPSEPMSIPTEVYTLNKISDSEYVRQFFSGRNFTILDGTSAKEKKYQSVQDEIHINSGTQFFIAEQSGDFSSYIDTKANLFRRSLSQISRYETWRNGIRIMDSQSTVQFRHYLNGYPVISMNMNDYGAMRVTMLNEKINFRGPMFQLFSHVSDQSENMDIPSVQDIIYVFNQYGYLTTNFDNIFIGYQFLDDTEDFQIAKFVPTWFFDYNGVRYSWADIQDGKVRMSDEMAVQTNTNDSAQTLALTNMTQKN